MNKFALVILDLVFLLELAYVMVYTYVLWPGGFLSGLFIPQCPRLSLAAADVSDIVGPTVPSRPSENVRNSALK